MNNSRVKVAAITLACTAAIVAGSQLSFGAAFAGGTLVISRVGDGSAPLTSAGTAIFLDNYSTSGANLSNTVALPTTASDANRRLVTSGSATSEGALTLSADGNYLTIPGYDAAVGATGIASSTSAAANRVVAVINVNTQAVNTATAIPDGFSGNNIRTAVSTDGANIWAAGASDGVRFLTENTSTAGGSAVVSATVTNIRVANIYSGDLYVSTGSGTNRGIYKISGEPTSGPNTATLVAGTGSSSSPYDFVFTDDNTLYITDDRALASGGGLEKWTLSGGTWTMAYDLTTNLTATAGLRGLTYDPSTGTFYALTADSLPKLVSIVDTGATSSFTILATSPTNEAFRGIEFIPAAPLDAVPEPASLGLLAVGSLAMLLRRRK